MRCILRSDKSFKEFLNSGHSFFPIIAVLVFGVLLVLFSSFDSGRTDKAKESELTEICSSLEGVGRCRTVVTYSDEDGAVCAVAVLCEGADSPKVKARINELVSSLYGIGSNRIAVLKIE